MCIKDSVHLPSAPSSPTYHQHRPYQPQGDNVVVNMKVLPWLHVAVRWCLIHISGSLNVWRQSSAMRLGSISRGTKKRLTVRWQQRCSCLVMGCRRRDVCRSPSAHCGWREERENKEKEKISRQRKQHTQTLRAVKINEPCCQSLSFKQCWGTGLLLWPSQTDGFLQWGQQLKTRFPR